MTEYEQLAKELKATENDEQFVKVLRTALLIEYNKGFDKGYRVGYDDGLNHSWCRYGKV